MEEINNGMEHIRSTLLKDIELQEQLRITYDKILATNKKILRRATAIYIGVALMVLMGFGFVIYYLLQPAPATLITLKNIENIQKNVELEHKLVLMDREDVTKARTQVVELQRILFKQDSIKQVTK